MLWGEECEQKLCMWQGKRRQRFPGVRLTAADRHALQEKTKGRARLSGRMWRDPGLAGPGMESDGHGRRSGRLPTRGAAGRQPLLGARVGSGAERRAAAKAGQDARRQAAGCDRGDGLRAATGRSLALDHRADGARDEAARDSGQGGAGDHPPIVCEPRAEAVAGKKCGACPSSTRNTSPAWKRCWTS